ncbi:MAG: hypothetical protein ACK4MS_08695 [Paracoccaceae bacterium]
MSLLRSAPHLDTPWRDLLTAAIVALLLPSAVGGLLIGVFHLFGERMPPTVGLFLFGPAMALMLSPLLSFAGMMLAVPLSSILIRAGWFGWLPAAANGFGVGSVMGALFGMNIAAPFGLCALLILRATLGRLRPMDA